MDIPFSSQKSNPWMISTLLLVGIIIGFGIAQLPSLKKPSSSAPAAGVTATQEQPVPNAEPKREWRQPPTLSAEDKKKILDDDPVIGDKNAPVTIVEFSDYQCPFCAKFFQVTLSLIDDNYIKNGKVKLVYRDFPLESLGHFQAIPAALASECADEQGKFRQMHDKLFQVQREWAGNPDAINLFKDYAKQFGLNTKKFNECLDTKQYASEIQKDFVDGTVFGVNGTPSFFINGKEISGALPFAKYFKPILDAELANKKWELEYTWTGKDASGIDQWVVTDIRVP